MTKIYQGKKALCTGHIGYHKIFHQEQQIKILKSKAGLERFLDKYPNWQKKDGNKKRL